MIRGLEGITKIPELKRRIGFTFLMLAIYRVGTHVPSPGINATALADFFKQAKGTLFGMVNMFTGGALERFSVFALGIMPYISASIILQLLTVVWPYLEKLSKEGEMGRKKITQYTRYGTVILSIIQSLGMSYGLEGMTGPGGQTIVPDPGWSFRLMTVITLTSGTAFLMWLGEQITERGIGNGISLLIFAGIVTDLPPAVSSSLRLVTTGEMDLLLLMALLAFMVLVVGAIIFFELGHRRISVQYAKRVVGKKVYGGQTTHLPLKVNTSGVIPPIFASSILMFPLTIANFLPKPLMDAQPWLQAVVDSLGFGRPLYNLLYIIFIIFFCYFYTAVVFNPVDVAENMKKHGGYIPGVRPGKKTADYIDRILSRITLIGAIYVSAVCVLPNILITRYNVPFYFGGTGLMIVVGVTLDTAQQIETHMLSRSYEGFMKKGRIRGRALR